MIFEVPKFRIHITCYFPRNFRLVYCIFAPSIFILKDTFDIDSGKVYSLGTQREIGPERYIGEVVGMHKVVYGRGLDAAYDEFANEHQHIKDRYDFETNFIRRENRIGLFDQGDKLHTIIEVERGKFPDQI